MASPAVLVIHSIIQLYSFVPIGDVWISIKTVVSGSFCRKLPIRFGGCTFHVKLAMQFRFRDIIEVIIWAERIIGIIV